MSKNIRLTNVIKIFMKFLEKECNVHQFMMLQNGRKCLFQNPSCSVLLWLQAEPLVKTPTPLFEIRSMFDAILFAT